MSKTLKNKDQAVKMRRLRRKNAVKRGRPIGSYKGRFLLDNKKKELIQLLDQSKTFNFIAHELGVHMNTVQNYLKKNPTLIPNDYHATRINPRSKLYNKEAYILQKLKEGVSKATIARELGVSREGLFNKLHQMGWKGKKFYCRKKIDLNLFLKLFCEKKTYQEMADIFQCHKQTIINKVKELHLSRNQKNKSKTANGKTVEKQVSEGLRQ